ncbi:hypothetical protein M405DRAFT_838450 [Rhizopogon salebrosus TDB-379]|nr:hypothetical protein M405DRAFT_838450 [Rhizopogon salebrosus TDB-379]
MALGTSSKPNLSSFSIANVHSPLKEGVLGAGHVRRRSVGFIPEVPLLIRAKHCLWERQSLAATALIADEQRISTANDHRNDLDSRPSSPSSAPPRYLRDRSQRKLPSHHCSHTTTDESTSHLLARLITRNDEVREINALLVVTCEPPPLETQILSTATIPHFIAYFLHRTKLHSFVTFAALVLLQRLKALAYTPHTSYHPHRKPASASLIRKYYPALLRATVSFAALCFTAKLSYPSTLRPTSHSTSSFVEKDSELLDSAFVTLLRNSSDGFMSKLVSGPSLAAERHSKEEVIIIYAVTTQLDHTLPEIIASLDRTRLWTISCMRANDSGSPNSFDRHRVRAQAWFMPIPDIVARRSVEFITDLEEGGCALRAMDGRRGWTLPLGIVVSGWRIIRGGLEDVVRAAEKEQTRGSGEEFEDEESVPGDDVTDSTHGESMGNGGCANESRDNSAAWESWGAFPGLGTLAYEDDIHGDHSDISGTASIAANDLEELAYKNFTAVVPLTMHKCGSWQSVQNTASQRGLVHHNIPAEDEELSQGASGLGH